MLTFHSIDKESLDIGDISVLFGDVVLFISPLLDKSDDPSDAITKINAIFDRFSGNSKFNLMCCVIAQDFTLRNPHISRKLTSPA